MWVGSVTCFFFCLFASVLVRCNWQIDVACFWPIRYSKGDICDYVNIITSHKIVNSFCWERLCLPSCFEKASGHVIKDHVAMSWGSHLANSQQETVAFTLTTHEPITANSRVILGMNPSPVEPQIRLCETLQQRTQLSHTLTSEP